MDAEAADSAPRDLRVEFRGGQVGDHNVQQNTFIQSPPAAEPGPVVAGRVPQVPPAFQPREDLLSALAAAGPGVSVVRAVTGMRGVGKTQVAAAYARKCIDECWRLVAWIDAEDAAGILNGLAVVAGRLGIEVPEGTDLTVVGEQVRNRLEADGDRCLLVFDNVTDVAALRSFVPSAGRSQILITSTAASASALGIVVPVGVFTESEALAFLRERTGRDDPAGARDLAKELGYLPLAIAQAAAVIAAQQLPYPKYLERLRSFSIDDYLAASRGEQYQLGVAHAILLTRQTVMETDRTGLCGALLDVVSLLSVTGVPRELLYAAGRAGVFIRPEGDSDASEQEIDEALAVLADASLLILSGDGAGATAHLLVMRVCRERLIRHGVLLALGARIGGLLAEAADALGEPWRNRLAARDMVRQIIALNENIAPHLGSSDTAPAKRLLTRQGWALWCLNQLGDSALQAIAVGEQLVEERTRILGEEHPDTLVSRNNLGDAYQSAGRAADAAAVFERALADRVRVLGEVHPDTLISRNNLAYSYWTFGRRTQATALLERTLNDSQRMLGEDDPNTLLLRNNLAYAYQAAGRLGDAVPLFERALADRVRVLGEEHPDTLMSRNNLAYAYRAAGRAEDAIPLYEQTLTDRVRVLGEEHPDTLMSRNNLAYAYRAAGRLGEAIPLHEQALAGFERVWGKDHPSTRACRGNLQAARRAARDLARPTDGEPSLRQTKEELMEPVTLIVTALMAGAAAAVQDGVKDAVKDTYRRLRDAVKQRLAGRPDGQLALERHKDAPNTWSNVLTAELVDAGAADDTRLIEAAQELLRMVDEEGAHSPTYNFTIHDSQGIQFGDHNTQNNTF